MIRKPRIKPKTPSENPESDASLRLDWERDVSGMEHSMLDTSPLPVAALAGPNHIIRYVNSAFCRLACKAKDELIGKLR
jgi:hypothetical protein